MKPKTIVTVILLLFVAASIVALITQGLSKKPSPTATQSPESSISEKERAQHIAATEETSEKNAVIAYYFHGNMRCMTCKAIEAQASEAIKTGFPKALEEGRVEWRVVNVDEPGNEHYVMDFELTTRSVVLERMENGEPTEWKNLDRVWELVKDKSAFREYIMNETRSYLEAPGP